MQTNRTARFSDVKVIGYRRVAVTPLILVLRGALRIAAAHFGVATSRSDWSALAHSSSPEHNPATRHFPACQGWGRGFESLRPLQVLSDRSRGSAAAFCVSGGAVERTGEGARLPAGYTDAEPPNLAQVAISMRPVRSCCRSCEQGAIRGRCLNGPHRKWANSAAPR
jgi:hypothetical protein